MKVVGNILHALFCLPVGAFPVPPERCSVIEMIIDLASRLVQFKNWDPTKLNSLWSTNFPTIELETEIKNPQITYEVDIDVPITKETPAGAEDFVEHGIGTCAGDKQLMERMYGP